VAAGAPNHRDHFDALHKLASLEAVRGELESLWDALVGQVTGTSFSSLGQSPELACRAIIPEIRRCLDWHSKSWLPLVERLKAEGLKLDEISASLPRETSPIADYLLIERLAVNVLPPLLEAEIARRRLKECEDGFKTLTDLASKIDAESPDRGCVGRILAAVRSRNTVGYADALGYARRLHTVRPLVEERTHLIEKLSHVAPGWAGQVALRVFPHCSTTVPGDVNSAWIWRQLHDELRERDKLDAQELQKQIDKTRTSLRELTILLIDGLAWGKQIERLQGNNAVRQALVGWLDTTKRLVSTRQASKRQMLLTEARKLMKQCAKAVPVWVMPIAIMAESFDPKTTRFDVVIIDEASQADLNALIPLYMAKQVIIVGDHEQVTPLGVGKDQVILENLRRSILQDIPNAHLYDNLSSIYDIARQSFGDAIRLAEHFRCVPEIIAFSNQLSYNGTIRPLRETNSSNLKPACIPYRVHGIRENATNTTEAETIVSVIEAMIKHPAYNGKTIGVISMVGEPQAIKIETLLHKRIDSVEIQKRRIQAGISAQFQGDERDVIFLSFIDSQGEEGYMRSMGEGAFELIKKRFNVATSRARDQLWAMYSFDPDRHLKADDMRLKLLQHMKDPWAAVNAYSNEVGKTDSDFERQVLKRLTDSGYRVKAQWQVGYYRIDLVVEGDGKRLAVECDGDRYHPIEKLEDDIARQTVLERLGWKFVRIRGSAFYRSPEEAMKPVFERLSELGIPATGQAQQEQIEDWTLLHELEDIIAVANESAAESAQEEEPQNESHEDNGQNSQAMFDDVDLSNIQQHCELAEILRVIGGKTHIETLLRSWAQVRGYKRIGKNIKLAFDNELNAHERQGTIRVSNDIVGLLQA
jgi:very-short-patch-repair endonuclease